MPQNKDLQINSLPSETSMDYTKCMKLTKKHGIVSENMEYTRMFWSFILPIHHLPDSSVWHGGWPPFLWPANHLPSSRPAGASLSILTANMAVGLTSLLSSRSLIRASPACRPDAATKRSTLPEGMLGSRGSSQELQHPGTCTFPRTLTRRTGGGIESP